MSRTQQHKGAANRPQPRQISNSKKKTQPYNSSYPDAKGPFYKVFEKSSILINGTQIQPQIKKSDTSYTTLGVRNDEVICNAAQLVISTPEMPQGMSLLSDETAAMSSVNKPKSKYGIFRLPGNIYHKSLSILQDPRRTKHYLWGPRKPMSISQLNNQIQSSANQWQLIYQYNPNGYWEPTLNEKLYTTKFNKHQGKLTERYNAPKKKKKKK